MNRIIGIDPGSESCGMIVLDGGQIASVFNIMLEPLWDKVTNFLDHPNCQVVIEDIRPYSTPLTPQVVDTCKFIGEAVYRLRKVLKADVALVTRAEVKKWVFDNYLEVGRPYIEKKMLKKAFPACMVGSREEVNVFGNGDPFKMRSPSFVYVDDIIVREAMKAHYKIPLPPPGSGYQYGLKDDAWQALALATCYYTKLMNSSFNS